MHRRLKKNILLLGFCLVMLAGGCASFGDKSKKVILQNPETMEFVDCKVDKWGTKKSFETNEECVKNYQAKGYVIWGER
ncbi:MAG: hypothetical protein JRC87_06410 [Deltaproteobacteria bacterium]|nr:hypothetical protein [Deltaproteobacteria bacterium]MBW2659213.1 hypothetical protein [Deltaproteobacteria bacterium]